MGQLQLAERPDPLLIEWVLRLPNKEADQLLVEMVCYEMQDKLERKRIEGRGGWYGPNCSNSLLMEMLREHVGKGDMIDVINLAGMILARSKLYGESA